MLIFGHLGIGSEIARPWAKGLPRKWLFVGTLLPDLIDKPIYTAVSLLLHKQGAELGLISGTHTFGHTAFFTLALALGSFLNKSHIIGALALGSATHLLLDQLGPHRDLQSLLWPALGWHFPAFYYISFSQYLKMLLHPYMIGGEIVGIFLLVTRPWRNPSPYRKGKK